MDYTNKEQHKKDKEEMIKRTEEDPSKSKEKLLKLSTYIKQLNSYINNDIELSSDEIYTKLQWMFSKLSFNFIYELEENIFLRRARKFEEKNTSFYCFQNTKELSYIKNSENAKMNRLNQDSEPMYYGVISHPDFDKFETALSEINADELDYVNILDSKTNKSLTTLYIGAFDLFVKDKEFPKWIHPILPEIYQIFSNKCKDEKNPNPDLLESHILCSAFFADIMSRKEKDNLYKVTSTLASIILKTKNPDSIIYESVQVKGVPSIVIKPTVVDDKIEHIDAVSVQVTSNLGEGIYEGIKLYESESIENDGDIVWRKI